MVSTDTSASTLVPESPPAVLASHTIFADHLGWRDGDRQDDPPPEEGDGTWVRSWYGRWAKWV